jgi:hypothetical protein
MSAKDPTPFEVAVSALTADDLLSIVRLAALTEESYHPGGVLSGDQDDEDHPYSLAIGEHPDPDSARGLLMELARHLPR